MAEGVEGGQVLLVVDKEAEQEEALGGRREQDDSLGRIVERRERHAGPERDYLDRIAGDLLVVADEKIVGRGVEGGD